MLRNTVGIILLLFYLHGIGLWLFIRGFLLSRLSLSEITTCKPAESCTLPATHKKAVVLIIDALRFDFISPEPPEDLSPYHHGVLTFPAELTAKYPQHSFIFNAHSDPPTTTLQRIKGITTGSLPTFVEMGSNFGASEIEEDSIIRQLRARGKKIAFMGDDTWMLVFPKSFHPNMTHPFDSFNVEDLHTVDNGVIKNIFPLLKSPSSNWDFIIGHFLGVDHVGHRLGPDHPTMETKLKQMNNVLRQIVDLLDDDTLLVLMGDHGMDRRGDHGGDSIHETSSALWIYSKSIPLSYDSNSSVIPSSLRTHTSFPGILTPYRSVQQIDIVPTLSLLLGLPIPFNNLGTPIPELFIRKPGSQGIADDNELLRRALELTAAQINAYLQAYRGDVSGRELDNSWAKLHGLYTQATTGFQGAGHDRIDHLIAYTRGVLSTCRELWAQFDGLAMVLGLMLLGTSVVCSICLFNSKICYDDAKMCKLIYWAGILAIIGPIIGLALGIILGSSSNMQSLVLTLFITGLTVSMLITFFSFPGSSLGFSISCSTSTIVALLHAVSFFSNSFVFWEDRVVPFLLASTIIPQLIKGLPIPVLDPTVRRTATARLHWRVIGYSLLALVCTRLMSLSTVCREEQQPYCHVTFYASSSVAAPPISMLLLSLLAAYFLPFIIQRFLHISRSDSGPALPFLAILLRGSLIGGTISWSLEHLETISAFGDSWGPILRATRTIVARFILGGGVIVGYYTWNRTSLCLEVVPATSRIEPKKVQLQIIGFANAVGSSYLLFVVISVAITWAATQLTGQVILALGIVFMMAWLEVVDSLRDLRKADIMNRASSGQGLRERDIQSEIARADKTIFADILPFCMLALLMFYGTGHQSTLQSLQWKSAFLLTEKLVYPFSPLLVIINTFGSITLIGIALPLLAAWNVTPSPYADKLNTVEIEALRTCLAAMSYFGCLLLGSAASAAWLRRHLMVWKVFAPRFMAGAAGLVAVDLGICFGLFWGLPVVSHKVETFAKISRRI